MEFMFHICNCTENCQVKYATCTLLDIALTWWNSHMKTVGIDVAYAMTWKELMKMITEVYCPRNGIQKMENELWNLIVKDNDVVGYTQRFQELALLRPKMVPDEEEKIERMMTTKESRKMSRKEIIANNKTRGKKWVVYMLLELVIRQAMLELYHSATSASFITTVHVPLIWKMLESQPPSKRLLDPYLIDMLWMSRKMTHQE
ncbi:reverse transcriptase domain-containing protein, partial [Tanacetum coccineum]